MFQHKCVICLLTISLFAGELPKELGKLVNLTELFLGNNEFQGDSYVPSYMRLCVLLTFHPFVFAGELPKELGNLVNLTELFLNGNHFRGKLYVPSYIRNLAMYITEFLCVFA